MRRLPQLMLITTVILLTALIISLAVTPNPIQNNPTTIRATVTRHAPDFTLTVVDVNGLTNKTFTFSSLKGKPVFIDFVFEWCPHCNNMAPIVERLYQTYGDRVVFITVAGGYRSTVEKTSEYVRKHNIAWTVVYDGGMEVFGRYSVRGTPTYVAVSPSGAIVGRLEGEQAYTAIEELVKAALAG
ncbi:MAG: TlpA disulfide reductase family protein [Candidatus Caldarchaeum sp.]